MKINNHFKHWFRRWSDRDSRSADPNPTRDWLASLAWAVIVIVIAVAALGGWRGWVLSLEQEIRTEVTAATALTVSEAQVKSVTAAIAARAAARASLETAPLADLDPSR